MFNNDKRTQNSIAKFQTLIGAKCTIKGTLQGSEIIKIQGTVIGDIIWEDTTILEEGSVCTGNISCSDAIINGSVDGNVTCSDSLTISSSGSIKGDVSSASLIVEEGGTLHGKCSMVNSKNDKNLFLSEPTLITEANNEDTCCSYEDKE